MEYEVYRYRWVIVGASWLILFAFGANWLALAPMLTVFQTLFSIQVWQSNLLISLIGIFVILLAWPAGELIEKHGPKLSTSIEGFFMALGFGLRSFLLGSFPTLLLSSVVSGLGLAWILVALGPQLLLWFPKTDASLATGIAASGLFMGFGTGALAMPKLVPTQIQTTYDMFNGFLVFGILAIAAFFIWLLAARDHPPKPPEARIEVPRMKFHEGIKHVFDSRNGYIYPIIGFFVVGMTVFNPAFLNRLYPGQEGGYIAGFLLYGCAGGAFIMPFREKIVGLKRVTIVTMLVAIACWLTIGVSNSYEVSWLFLIPVAFLFGLCLNASWPLALYCQETEAGVSAANVGIATSVYTSVSNMGPAVLPVLFPLVFKTNALNFIAVLGALVLCVALWASIKRK